MKVLSTITKDINVFKIEMQVKSVITGANFLYAFRVNFSFCARSVYVFQSSQCSHGLPIWLCG